MAVADASFSTLTLSTSFMFIIFNGTSVGTPSITSSGSLPTIEPTPRIFIDTLSPGAPFDTTCRPVALPCRAAPRLDDGCLPKSFDDTDDMAPVRSFFFIVP